jgi:hypothetical protein
MVDASTSGDRNARFNGCDHRAKITAFWHGPARLGFTCFQPPNPP